MSVAASLLATTNPGDEVIVFEPFYESYHPDTLLCGAERKLVTLHTPDWHFDPDELRRAFSHPHTSRLSSTRPITPQARMLLAWRATDALIASLCQEFDAIAITDEIYEHIVYDGARHIPMITLPGMRDRTILVNSLEQDAFAVTDMACGLGRRVAGIDHIHSQSPRFSDRKCAHALAICGDNGARRTTGLLHWTISRFTTDAGASRSICSKTPAFAATRRRAPTML